MSDTTAAESIATARDTVRDAREGKPSAAPAGRPSRPDVLVGDDGVARCAWVGADTEYQRYHDEEWGTPLHDDRALYEKICLEGFQAGLSWRTILLRRPAFREAFNGFDIDQVAAFTENDVEQLVQNAAIIRHRGKIEATIANARATLSLSTPLSELIWSFAPSEPHRHAPVSLAEIPAVTPEATALSKRLRELGFRFVGPTTMYALMQSAGLVDDHVAGCWRALEPA
ncbi:DNA-3-methyladenine glycosylase I [Planctomonas sp. JC2975]|uniref:DNA-3-methyladenine glycosylase I n=1 Tax=Planctomonas sp. JC2975 TaxID=2729626 RepID=UPI0014765C53|nr:DNA-3-methyladenine glycosylase I [Planctomonas sp. JC2975]NNC13207.1 DNA-3-methyladenine glycosylase I [Planctomonas sp. JC2975]